MTTRKEISITGHGLSTMCRLCLKTGVTVLDIFFFSTTLRNQVADTVMKYFPVQITRHDEMPKFICQLCFTQLENIHQFQIQVVQSEKTLRQYLQKLHGSDKEIKSECSIRSPPKDSLIHKDNTNADITVKSELLDMDVVGKDKATANFNSTDKINEEMSLISEIKEESTNDNSFSLTEYTNGTSTGSSNGDWSEISCENSKIDIGDTKLSEDMLVNWKENGSKNLNSTHKFTEEMSLKSEIKEEPDAILINTTDIVSNACQFNNQDTQLIDLNVQKSMHTSEHRCNVCNKCFSRSYKLKIHKRLHTGERPYQCDVCNKCFSRSDTLKSHKRLHTGEKPFQCDVCSKSFRYSCNMSEHKRTHTGERQYQCDVCNKCFPHLGTLKRHKRLHTDERPFQCDVCSKSFRQTSHLTSHKRLHTGERPYQCDVCSMSFLQSNNLARHMRAHNGDKPYQCDVCNKSFRESSELRKHKRTHNSEKPYQCDVCNKSFRQSWNLSRHKRTHNGEKPYQCDVCNKSFCQSSNLSRHKRTHNAVKSYQCDVCNKSFRDSSNLSRHKRTHNGE